VNALSQLEPHSAAWQSSPVHIGLDEPVTVESFLCRGASLHPLALITAGVHGDEYEGPAAVQEFSRLVDPHALRGSAIAIPVANPMAFAAGRRTSPCDGVNLARTFPGDPSGSPTERLAAWLFDTFVREAGFLIDLHSGGVEYVIAPLAGFYGAPAPDNATFVAAAHFGLPYLWQLPETSGVLSCEAHKLGIVSIGNEYLGAGQLSEEGLSSYVEGISRCLELWAIAAAEYRSPPQPHTVFAGDWQLSGTAGIFRARCSPGDSVKCGGMLAEITDLRGAVVERIVSERAGTVLGLRSKAFIGEGNWAVLIGTPLQGDL
jgi:predicted deacylase